MWGFPPGVGHVRPAMPPAMVPLNGPAVFPPMSPGFLPAVPSNGQSGVGPLIPSTTLGMPDAAPTTYTYDVTWLANELRDLCDEHAALATALFNGTGGLTQAQFWVGA